LVPALTITIEGVYDVKVDSDEKKFLLETIEAIPDQIRLQIGGLLTQ
jgi:hypothetical protein